MSQFSYLTYYLQAIWRIKTVVLILQHFANTYLKLWSNIGMFNGYLTFVFSILMIGLVTAVIGDVAGHLGCFIFLKDSVNAIAFVALGTSVPGKVHFIKTKILQAQVFMKLRFYFYSQNLYFCFCTKSQSIYIFKTKTLP